MVVGLVYSQWQDQQKLRSIDDALGQVADAAVAKFQKQVKEYTESQISAMDSHIK